MSNANPEGSRFRWQGFDFIFVTEENHPWKNWLCFKHPDGQWVSLHKCESADLATWKARAEKAEKVCGECKPYLSHRTYCDAYYGKHSPATQCTCGLDELLKKVSAVSK